MNVVVAAGATVAPVDRVRRLTNLSTGGTAARIAESCLEQGASVHYIHTPGALEPYQRKAMFQLDAADPQAEHRRLDTLRQEFLAVRDRLIRIPLGEGTVPEYQETLRRTITGQAIDIAILPIAVADYLPEPSPGKIPSHQDELMIRCRRAPKVIAQVRDWSPAIFLVGFKLLWNASREELARIALEACRINRADLTVANDLALHQDGRRELILARPGKPVEIIPPGDQALALLVERILAWSLAKRAGGGAP